MRRRRFNLTLLLVMLGSALAWAGSAGSSLHTPFLFNRTSAAVDVRMTWVLRRVPCETTPEALAATLGPSDLDDPRAVTLDSGEVVTLNGASAPGVCPSQNQITSPPDRDCRAAILETPGATPVLLVASQNWRVEGESYFCTPGPSSLSRCAPTLGLADDGGDEAVALISHDGTLAFEVSRVTGQASRTLRIAPVDPAAIAARPTSADGCGPVRDAYRALARATACTSDSDCQAITGIAIPGDGGGCTLFVNQTVSAAAVDAVKAQWSAGLCASGTSCLAPLGAVCRAGACGEACAGVALPSCETSCDNYNPDGICGWLTFDCAGSSEQCHPTCTNAALQRCTCKNNNTVVCEPRPLVDPTCPLPCRP